MTHPPIAVETRITGRVQGVWFRAWTRDEAVRLNLTGWVRNEPDGAVRAVFCGPPAVVAEMLALAHGGPPLAEVDAVETRSLDPVPALIGFEVRR